MIRLYFILLACFVPTLVPAQRMSRAYIPHGAIFYNSRWQGVASADKASYYRVLAVDDSGRKMFYDYFITGQLPSAGRTTATRCWTACAGPSTSRVGWSLSCSTGTARQTAVPCPSSRAAISE